MSTTDFADDFHPHNDSESRSGILGEALENGYEAAVPRCEKCAAPISTQESMVCRSCGWYASIGSYVEIDREWETCLDPDLDQTQQSSTDEEEKFTVPTWAWILVGCTAAIFAVSFVVAAAVPEGSALKTYWSVTQLFLGCIAFAVCHTVAFVRLISTDSHTSVVDILANPHKPWLKVAYELPARQWLVQVGTSGMTAAVLAMVLIGNIPYERLLDWGFKEPPKQNLMAAVMSKAHEIESTSANLEESIEEFAGSREGLDENGNPIGDEAEKNTPQEKTDCVIIGFQADDSGKIYSLILGAEFKRELRYVARVTPQLSDEEMRALFNQLSQWKIKRPYAPIDMEATWVKPKQVCRINYRRQGDQGWLYDAELAELGDSIDLPGE